jgi:hypothetical protein
LASDKAIPGGVPSASVAPPAPARAPTAPLDADAIISQLEKADDPAVIQEFYKAAEAQLSAESAHSTKLDARATSLFGAVGFSMTVAFSFGGWSLLENVRKVPFGSVIAVAFVLVLGVGLWTSWLALHGLLLRDGGRFPDERELLHPEVVAKGKKAVDYQIHVGAHYRLAHALQNDGEESSPYCATIAYCPGRKRARARLASSVRHT